MNTFRYFKKKVLLLVFFFGISFAFFSNVRTASARESAFIACLIDDESNMYKTQVIYSGQEIEYGRIANFTNIDLRVGKNLNFVNIMGYDGEGLHAHSIKSINFCEYEIDKDTGKISITLRYVDPKDPYKNPPISGYNISSEMWADLYNTASSNIQESVEEEGAELLATDSTFLIKLAEEEIEQAGIYDTNMNNWRSRTPVPLTFPTNQNVSANENDINRAYAIADLLGDNYRDALLYINDGKSYESVDVLIDSAYALVTTNEGTITNRYGNKYYIKYDNNPDESSYVRNCTITKIGASSDDVDRKMQFVYAVKKGYKECGSDDLFEDGTKNKLSSEKSSSGDTVYITWQQLFLEAGIFYAEGVSYSNQADLYEIGNFEKSMVETFRNFLSGIQNKLQLYTIEDCIFNNSIRGSRAFRYGVYQDNLNPAIFRFYMIMLAFALSLTAISIIAMVLKKQWSVASPVSRYSMMNGIRDIVITVFLLTSLWVLIRFMFMCNFEFVKIWSTYLDGKSMSATGGYNSLSAILYAFIFFIIRTYVNIIYILRGLIVPMLIIISPLCVFAFSMGITGKKLTGAWFKEILGNVFIQSFHALIFGFILVNCNGLRGIEALCVYASIIPLTSIIRQITGVGGGELLKKGSQLTTAVGSTIGAGVQAGASIEASRVMAEAQKQASHANIIGTTLGTFVGTVAAPFTGGTSIMMGQTIGSSIGSMAGADIVASGAKKAGAITAGGGMFNAGMGMAMNTVLDSGDGGSTQSGISAIERGERQKNEAEGQRAQTYAQAVDRMASNIARTKMMENRFNHSQEAEVGVPKGYSKTNYSSINNHRFRDGHSSSGFAQDFSDSVETNADAIKNNETGQMYNRNTYSANQKRIESNKSIIANAFQEQYSKSGGTVSPKAVFSNITMQNTGMNHGDMMSGVMQYAKSMGPEHMSAFNQGMARDYNKSASLNSDGSVTVTDLYGFDNKDRRQNASFSSLSKYGQKSSNNGTDYNSSVIMDDLLYS